MYACFTKENINISLVNSFFRARSPISQSVIWKKTQDNDYLSNPNQNLLLAMFSFIYYPATKIVYFIQAMSQEITKLK